VNPTFLSTPILPNQKVELLCEGAYVIVTPSPGKQWINAPNGQLPEIDPFGLGLEKFGISRPGTDAPDFTEETEDTEEVAVTALP